MMPRESAPPPSTIPVIVSIDGPATAGASAVPIDECVTAPDPINPASGQMGPCVLFIGEPEFPNLTSIVAVADEPVPHGLPETGFSSSSMMLVASLLVAAGGLLARRRHEVRS
jgi:LPXTG-motif cell wall-anchored protein